MKKIWALIKGAGTSFLDDYARARGDSRSAALHRAVRLLRERGLGADYAAAWEDWEAGEAATWDVATGDGLDRDAAR